MDLVDDNKAVTNTDLDPISVTEYISFTDSSTKFDHATLTDPNIYNEPHTAVHAALWDRTQYCAAHRHFHFFQSIGSTSPLSVDTTMVASYTATSNLTAYAKD